MSDDQALRETLMQRMRSQGLKLPAVARRLEVSPRAIEAFLNGAKLNGAALAVLPEILADKKIMQRR